MSTRFLYVRYDEDTADLQSWFRIHAEVIEAKLAQIKLPITVPGHLTEAEFYKVHERLQGYAAEAVKALELFYMNVGKVLRDRQILRGAPPDEVKERGE